MKHLFIALILFGASHTFGQSANLTTVLNNYVAFGKGDVPAIIASTTEDCTWTHPGNASVPFAGVFHGHAGLTQFFDAVGKSILISTF